MKTYWQENFYLPSYFVNQELEATLPGICYFLQEAAGNHATHHGMGYFDMQKKGQFWVLNRLRLQMDKFPKWKDTISIKTWVSNMKGPFSYRQFALFDESLPNGQAGQNQIGSASTLWVLLDSTSRRPTRIPSSTFPIIENAAHCGLPDKLRSIKGVAPDNAHLTQFPYQVLPSDLDMIGHVNNVKYVVWACNYHYKREMEKRFHFLEVNYLQETHLGDQIIYLTQEEGQQLHLFKKNNTDENLIEVCRLKFE